MKKRLLRKKIILIAAVTALSCCVSGTVYAEDTDDEQKAALVKTLSEKEQRGDLNKDGVINVFDLIRYKNSIIEDKDPGVGESADANSDGELNGKDISVVKADILKKSKIWSYKSMPKMDGSTSAIPLEAGLKSKMLGVSYYDAKQLVSHHKTHESFQMLLSGENDMIFTVPISEEQQKMADEAGVKLNFVPVAKEGFVFVVNKDNPVDSLTSAQIRDIYSGKITNWKEVGGNDAEIIPYQRNKDSGSQNYMTEFMEGYDLMDPPKTYILGMMSTLMDGLAVYDNAENAIGYSVYSYAAQMYENSSDTKFIAVDGIKPTRETMADGTYPLLSSTSIVYTDKASQNTKDFAAWAVSDEGQETVLASGYVPVKDMEYPDEMKPYYAKGTGKEKPAGYKPSEKYSVIRYFISDPTCGDSYIYYLKDQDFQEQINDDIRNIVYKGGDFLPGAGWSLEVTILNGYMNMTFIRNIGYYNEYVAANDSVYTLNYDLINSKRLENFSDLFYKDTDFMKDVNKSVGEAISVYCSDVLKTDYIGLLGDMKDFSFETVYMDKSCPYFDENKAIEYQSIYGSTLIDSMVTGEYFDCNEVIAENFRYSDDRLEFSHIRCNESEYPEWMSGYVQGDDGKLHFNFTSRFHTKDEIDAKNQMLETLLDKTNSLIAKIDPESGEFQANQMSEYFNQDTSYGSKIYAVETTVSSGLDRLPYTFMFDPETLENISVSDIFGAKFEKYNGGGYYISKFNLGTGIVTLYDVDWNEFSETIDFDALNMKRIIQAKVDVEERLQRNHGVLKGEGDVFYSYSDSYVLKYKDKETYVPLTPGKNVEMRNFCHSHGKVWYECWDEGDHYLGWISEDNVTVKYSAEEAELYDKFKFRFFDEYPVDGWAVTDESGIDTYSSDYIMGVSDEPRKVTRLENRGTSLKAKFKCLSHGEWWYECWGDLNGQYYGWINEKYFKADEIQSLAVNKRTESAELARPVKCTVLGEKFGGVYAYALSTVENPGFSSVFTRVDTDRSVIAKYISEFAGETWLDCSDATDGSYVGWINEDYLDIPNTLDD